MTKKENVKKKGTSSDDLGAGIIANNTDSSKCSKIWKMVFWALAAIGLISCVYEYRCWYEWR